MKKCPHCSCGLTQVDYEGFRVFQCGECRGHLVESQRLDCIKYLARKSTEELKAEAASEFRGSSPERVRCPRCHAPMVKEDMRLPGTALQMDVCRPCGLVWFDGGELALAQLGHQAGPLFDEAQEMKRRMEELEASPERKARFNESLDGLPDDLDKWWETRTGTGSIGMDDVIDCLLWSGRHC
jgi:Zn-finger nucleic acid-binding protein